MKKLNLQTKDKINENIQKLAKLFPNVVKEGEVDFEIFKQLFSDSLIEDCRERYGLNWVGKKESLLRANTPIKKTLRPILEKSVDFENTKNLYIEGNNFEVLKILQESYLNKIKMIYIDPPYNTGKDFIYKDNFTKNKDEYEEEIEAVDEEGVKLYKNTDSNGRFHSDWLSIMYERLLIARDLLKDDGVIFISIDDNEVHNLRHLCDEFFGEGNFVGSFTRVTKKAGKSTDDIANNNDYIISYSKNINQLQFNRFKHIDEGYKNKDEYFNERGYYKLSQPLDYSSIQYSPSLDYEIIIDNKIFRPGNVSKEEQLERIKINPKSDWCWRWSKELFEFGLKNNFIEIKNNRIYTKTYEKVTIEKGINGYEIIKKDREKSITSLEFINTKYSNDNSRKDIFKLFDFKAFDYSKPISLLETLIYISTSKNDDIILDFFSGSATTAHAVMELNAKDGGNRSFIMVQIPEKVDEKSEAYKAGYKTICDIGRDRIIRAAKKISQSSNLNSKTSNFDFGFRYFKTDTSNFKEQKNINDFTQQNLFEDISNIKHDRDELDLLFEVILNFGLELTLQIETKDILGKKVYFVEYNSLIACFDKNIDENLAKELVKYNPLKIVLKDDSFKTDSDKINFEQTIKELSPESDIWVV